MLRSNPDCVTDWRAGGPRAAAVSSAQVDCRRPGDCGLAPAGVGGAVTERTRRAVLGRRADARGTGAGLWGWSPGTHCSASWSGPGQRSGGSAASRRRTCSQGDAGPQNGTDASAGREAFDNPDSARNGLEIAVVTGRVTSQWVDTCREPGCHRRNSIAGWTDAVGPAISMTPPLLPPPVGARDARHSRMAGRRQWICDGGVEPLASGNGRCSRTGLDSTASIRWIAGERHRGTELRQ